MKEEEDDNLIDEDTIEYWGPKAVGSIIAKTGDKLTITFYGRAKLKKPYNNSDSILLLGKVAEKLDEPITDNS